METFLTAYNWLEKGISCVPLYRNTKDVVKGIYPKFVYSKQLPTIEQLYNWFYLQKHNLAVVCMNGLICLDLDFDDNPSCFDYLKHEDTYMELSKNGCHPFFWVDETTEDIDLSSLPKGIELKHNGLWVTSAPSVVKGFRYIGNGLPIARIKSLDDILEVKRKVKKETTINITVNGNNNTINLGNSFFTLRSPIERIKEALPILSYLSNQNPKQTSSDGRFYMCTCPSHKDSRPSFQIDTKTNRGTCKKQSCKLYRDKGFDVVGLHAELENLTMGQAVSELATRLNL